MVNVKESVKKLVQSLEAEFKSFEELPILSEDYVSKVSKIDGLVTALCELHPRWSNEDGVVRPIAAEDDQWGAEQEDEDLFTVFEIVEGLLWTWKATDASKPTTVSLLSVPRFATALYALVGKTEHF